MTSNKKSVLEGVPSIFGVDISIHDQVIRLTEQGEQKVIEFMTSLGFPQTPNWGSKNRLNDEQLAKLEGFVSRMEKDKDYESIDDFAGGSTANTAYNMCRVVRELQEKHGLKRDFKFKLLTVIGQSEFSDEIRSQYTEAGIEIIEPEAPKSVTPKHAKSIVFVPKSSGEKMSLTHPGTAPQILSEDKNPGVINEDYIKSAGAIFLQSSIAERFGAKTFDKITKTRWDMSDRHIPLILAYPTSAFQGRKVDNNKSKFVSVSSDIIVCNNEELLNIYHDEVKQYLFGSDYKNLLQARDYGQLIHNLKSKFQLPAEQEKKVDRALGYTIADELQKYLKRYKTPDDEAFELSNALMDALNNRKAFPEIAEKMDRVSQQSLLSELRGSKAQHNGQAIKPIAYITRGEKGCTVIDMRRPVGKESMDFPVTKAEVINTLGAGDSSYSGLFTGLLLGMDIKSAAEIGMRFASQKISELGSRISEGISKLAGIISSQYLHANLKRQTNQIEMNG